MALILVVEDEKNIRESLIAALEPAYTVKAAGSGEEALKLIDSENISLMITDIRLPGMSGLELIKKFRESNKTSPVIVITAFSSIQSAVEAMKSGANEYVPKPFSLEEIELKTANLLAAKKNLEEKEYYASEKDSVFGEMAGRSRAVERIKTEIAKVAGSDATVLITGETGTGKELAAYTIHRLSGKKGPFVPVNCAAFARGVIESELFGHEKGAFTGADKMRKGKIEYAEDGTLFLDELGDIPADIQVKLLRVLENRAFERVGSNKSITTNARVICATNRNLARMVKSGEFREDLYYRVNVFPMHIPPLRERPEDIEEIALRLLGKSGPQKKLTPDAAARLKSYPWPGNIRELQNIIERAVILSDGGELNIEAALGSAAQVEKGLMVDLSDGIEKAVEDMEKGIIQKTLIKHSFNQTKTSKELKISRTTLQYKMQKYGIKEQK
ncbi:MAG TPA: sigma-54-dependent Fis family transcriptional regulator [bacterium]|nr:sigma-54-dependent Fis family transcriptional regulator [bacterium]